MEQENFTTKELVIAFVKLSTMVFLAIALTSIVEQL